MLPTKSEVTKRKLFDEADGYERSNALISAGRGAQRLIFTGRMWQQDHTSRCTTGVNDVICRGARVPAVRPVLPFGVARA
jgi:hypothetical protein